MIARKVGEKKKQRMETIDRSGLLLPWLSQTHDQKSCRYQADFRANWTISRESENTKDNDPPSSSATGDASVPITMTLCPARRVSLSIP